MYVLPLIWCTLHSRSFWGHLVDILRLSMWPNDTIDENICMAQALNRSKVVKYPYILYWYPIDPNFNPFRLMSSRFRAPGHDIVLNDPKMTWNTMRSKVAHIYSTGVLKSQILLFHSTCTASC